MTIYVTFGTLILTKKIKNCLTHNKCIIFCLKLGDRTSIKFNEFEKINWQPIREIVSQCILSSIYKFHANNINIPDYMNKVFSHAESKEICTCCSYQKLKLPHGKINQVLRALTYIDPSLWNKLDKSLKTSFSLNAFKYNLKYCNKGDKKRVKSDRYNETIISTYSKKSIIIFNLFMYILIHFCLFLIFLIVKSLLFF